MARTTEKANALDWHIGIRIREQRENLGITQGELARAAGISYQQIHKYERGANRISAGRLGHLASIFNVPIQIFYDGFDSSSQKNTPDALKDNRLCLEVARNFRQIDNSRHQEALHLLVRVLAN